LQESKDQENDDDDDGTGQGGDSPPTYAVEDEQATSTIEKKDAVESPFERIFNVRKVDKFKIAAPKNLIKDMGMGSLSIESLKKSDKGLYMVVFRSMIGKTLFTGVINYEKSKIRRVEEKAAKNQLKFALVYEDPQTKVKTIVFCKCNLPRCEDMVNLEKHFTESLQKLKDSYGKKAEWVVLAKIS